MKKHIERLKVKIYQLLRWTEKWIKTDMVYLAKGGFWLTLGFIVSLISSFLLSIAFANLLSKEVFGTYKYILSLMGILGAFSLSGLGTVVAQSVARGFEGTFIQAFKTNVKWNGIQMIIGLSAGIYYYINNNFEFAIAMLIIAILAPVTGSLGLYNPFLNGKKEFKTTTTFNAVNGMVINLVLIVSLFIIKKPLYLISIYLITNLILALIFFCKTIKKYNPNKKIEPGAINYGKHLSLTNVFSIIGENIDKILLFHYLGAVPLAIYSFAIAPVSQIQSFLKLSNNLLIPKISSANKEELKKTLPPKAHKIELFMIVPVIIYIITIPYFFKIFFPQYLEAVIYSQIYSIILLAFPKKILGIAIIAHGNKKIVYKLSIINQIVYLSPKIVLIPLFGIIGAIAAELISNFSFLLLNRYFIKKI